MTSRLTAAVADAVGGQPCVVALGGGADSATLLYAATRAAPHGGVRAVFAFQGLEASHLLEKAARDITDRLGIGLKVVDATTIDGPDLEARARKARYAAIEADLAAGELVLTGHTADDQAETVLMRLMRGSGAGGLTGIPARRGSWTRPFLVFSRQELRTEADRLELPFVDDPANEDDRFLRSRIRHHLLPEIERNYAPGISSDLTRTAMLLGRDDEFLVSLSACIAVSTFAEHVALPAAALVSAPHPVATRAIRRALRSCGDAYPGSLDDVEAVLSVARTGSAAVIGGDVHVRRESQMVVLFTSRIGPCDPPMDVDGAMSFLWGRHSYRVERQRYPVAQRTAGRFTVISVAEADVELRIRSALPGDRIDIGVGATPVTELLRDHGVPGSSRSCWPLITIDGKIAAVHGIRTAAWATPHNGDDIMIIEQEVHS
jgi:tRNA(Ile)-lysidine synthase